ncbi:CCHC-type zinc finger, nucleic acid binding protein a [Elysia marginata]|uniref:CCHC-type zinc finger, nucleic acid binding protein a n=1 Tax=Elysia marginata TaxID=1093978 RepID=A0AAV4HKM7_9GAST|nr:CCHC-type zinc finger, nucleic acid binding protein a [Elysia marginata]
MNLKMTHVCTIKTVSAKTIAKESRCDKIISKVITFVTNDEWPTSTDQTFASTTPGNMSRLFNKTVYSGVIDVFPHRNFVSISYKRFIKSIFKSKVADKQHQQVTTHSQASLRTYRTDDHVLVRDYRGHAKWQHGQISSQTGFRNYDVEIAPGVIWRRHSDQIVPTSSPVPEPKSVPPPIPPIPVRSPATSIATSSLETPGESSNSIQLPSENNATGHPPASPKEVRTCPPSRPDPQSSVTRNNKHTQYNTSSAKLMKAEAEQHYTFQITSLPAHRNDADNTFLVDSGASVHIVKDRDKFSDLNSSFNPATNIIELAGGRKCSNLAEGQGDATIQLVDTNGIEHNVTLRNALYIPTFTHNIFSVRAATERGASVTFSQDFAILEYSETKFHIQKHDNLYYLCSAVASNSKNKTTHSLKEWHHILGSLKSRGH